MNRHLAIAAFALMGWMSACGMDADSPSISSSQQALTSGKTKLKVPLYPWIADTGKDGFAAMAARVEEEFMRENPDVELDANPACFKHDFYDVAAVTASLKGEDPACPVDIIEIDASFLGDLAESGAIQPWARLPNSRWHPASVEASTFNNQVFGVPHWMCTHFIFSKSGAVASAPTSSTMISALDGLGTLGFNFTGHFLGDWNLTAMYMDAWADTYGPKNVASAISATQVDPTIIASMKNVFAQCAGPDGSNHCLDGTFERWPHFYNQPVELFVNGQADATFNYFDGLNLIMDYLPAGTTLEQAGIEFNTLQLGNGNTPLVFTDSFVLSSRCTGACADAAQRFAEYIARTSTMEWMMASGDVPESIRKPRYEIVANLDAYSSPSIINDRFFQKADLITRQAKTFPNHGLAEVKGPMYQMILDGVTQ